MDMLLSGNKSQCPAKYGIAGTRATSNFTGAQVGIVTEAEHTGREFCISSQSELNGI